MFGWLRLLVDEDDAADADAAAFIFYCNKMKID